MSFPEVWKILGIAETADAAAVRRAYSRLLKVTQPEDDPVGFQRLRAAYERAKVYCDHMEGRGDIGRETTLAAPDLVDPHSETPHAVPILAPTLELAPPPATRSSVDAESADLDSALALLSNALRDGPMFTLPQAEAHLQRILSAPALERFDLLQRAEQRLADILLTNSPRSDPLLARVISRFGWDAAEAGAFRPPQAGAVVELMKEARLADHLQNGTAEDSLAYQRMAAPPRPLQRLWRAYGMYHSVFPEIALIDRLEYENPELLEKLDARNVAWWRAVRERPHVSLFTVIACVAIGVFGWLYAHAVAVRAGSTDSGGMHFIEMLGVLVLLGLFRVFALDWLAIYVRRRWRYRMPFAFAAGWLPVSVALMFVALMVRGMPALAWSVAGIAGLVALWAAIVGGPSRPALLDADFKLWNSRIVRIIAVNLVVFIWLELSYSYGFLIVETPLFITICAALVASAMSRQIVLDAVARDLTYQQRRGAIIVLGAVTLALFFLVIGYVAEPDFRPALLVGVVAVTALRRALPFATLRLSLGGVPPVLPLFLIFTIGRAGCNSSNVVTTVNGDTGVDFFIVGAIALLVGAAISVIRNGGSTAH